jgi:hypothetical protein
MMSAGAIFQYLACSSIFAYLNVYLCYEKENMVLCGLVLYCNVKLTSKLTNICRSFNGNLANESVLGPVGKDLFENTQDDLVNNM